VLTAFIAKIRQRKVQWMITFVTALGSIALGWYLGEGRPELYWPLERERLNVLFEYSQQVHVGLPLAFKAHDCRSDLDEKMHDNSHPLAVYMVGYGEDSCCTGNGCGSVGFKTRFGNGFAAVIIMIQSKENALAFGVRTIAHGHGERFADRLIVVADDLGVVRGIFHNLDQKHLEAALRYVVSRPRRGPSLLAYAMDRFHSWANDLPRRL
jgi:hypothetical protein